MELIVDKPKLDFLSTNDGNTARKFFKFSKKKALINYENWYNVNKEILEILLQTLLSNHNINIEKYMNFCIILS